jgi:hypothetical protein
MTGLNPFGRGAFLECLAGELSPPLEERRLGRDRYRDLGRWLREHAASGARDIEVYPQGSGNLGTTNRNPFTGEFDIDLVIRVAYAKREITRRQLNKLVNGWLYSYIDSRQRNNHPLAPLELSPGKRAWTLTYPRFHMDILPVVPDVDGDLGRLPGDPSWLTDKGLVFWQATNPRGFAQWFRRVSYREWYKRRVELAERAGVSVDDLPGDQVRTTLQMVVQLLKRHRDHLFSEDPDKLAPPSALITALAARAYAEHTPAGGNLPEVLSHVVAAMPNLLDRTVTGDLLVVNPTCDTENYADRYQGRRDKRHALIDWLNAAAADLDAIGTVHEAARVSKRIDDAFGYGLGERVIKRVGLGAQELRRAGAVGSTAAGQLRVDRHAPHQNHNFYGDPMA